MIFKKKVETEIEIDDREVEIIEKLDMFKRRYEQLRSDLNQGLVSPKRFREEEQVISDELDEMERNLNGFDDQMGRPMEWLDEIFKVAGKGDK